MLGRSKGGYLAATLLAAVAMTACAGQKARDHALVPALEEAWDGVREDAEYAQHPVEELDAMTAALDRRDADTAVAVWPGIETSANAGIDAQLADGVIGENVAGSFRERVSNFNSGLQTWNESHAP